MPHEAMSISASALSAQRTRLNVIAENLANANTTKTLQGGPYRRRVAQLESEAPAFASLLPDQQNLRGVKVTGVVQLPETRRAFLAGHPHADRDGYRELPDIHPAMGEAAPMAAPPA